MGFIRILLKVVAAPFSPLRASRVVDQQITWFIILIGRMNALHQPLQPFSNRGFRLSVMVPAGTAGYEATPVPAVAGTIQRC